MLDEETDEEDPFGFFRLTFGEFDQAERHGPSKSATVGTTHADVTSGQGDKKSGRSRRRTLEW